MYVGCGSNRAASTLFKRVCSSPHCRRDKRFLAARLCAMRTFEGGVLTVEGLHSPKRVFQARRMRTSALAFAGVARWLIGLFAYAARDILEIPPPLLQRKTQRKNMLHRVDGEFS
jgi:hypothetical protein